MPEEEFRSILDDEVVRLNQEKADLALEDAKARNAKNVDKWSIVPTGARVLVKRRPPADVTAGGILIPETAKEKTSEGEVVAVGEGTFVQATGTWRPIGVQIGAKVLFGKYVGTDVQIGGFDHVILNEDDVLGIVRESAE